MLRFAATSIVTGILAAASVWSVRLGLADYWFRQETIEAKARILGAGNWTYFVRSGLLFERRIGPSDVQGPRE